MLEIALASQSPRRRELLTSAGYQFRTWPIKVSEIIDENLNPPRVAEGLAERKAKAALEQHKQLKGRGFLVLAADTIVVIDGRILGKPANILEAHESLALLSSKTHSVMTGLCLVETGVDATKVWSGVEQTFVSMRRLSSEEIRAYVATGEPMDKAGAYAIQGEGGKFVSSYEGSWSNVVGLPMERLERAINDNGWTVRRQSTP